MTRILWFHPRPWGPARHGGDLRTRGLVLSALALGHEVLLVAPLGEGPDSHPGLMLAQYVGPRTQLVRATRKALSRDPLRAPRLRTEECSRLRTQVAAWDPQIAVVSEVMAWSVARRIVPRGLPMIYDAQNLERQRFHEMARSAANRADRLTLAIDTIRVGRAELALARRAGAIMAVSNEDRVALGAMAAGTGVSLVPSSVPTPPQAADPASSDRRVLFVGSLDYQPNEEAVRELADDIWPKVLEGTPDAVLVIVGRNPSRALRKYARDWPSIEIHADVESVEPYYLGARAVVAPLRSGGGTKLKVYEALSFGLPLVATRQAMHGVQVREGAVLRAETASDIAKALITVLTDPTEAHKIGARARKAFVHEMSWERASAPVLGELIQSHALGSPSPGVTE